MFYPKQPRFYAPGNIKKKKKKVAFFNFLESREICFLEVPIAPNMAKINWARKPQTLQHK